MIKMLFFSRLLLSFKTESIVFPLLNVLLGGMTRVTNLERETSHCQAQSFITKLSKQGKVQKCTHILGYQK